MTNKGPPSADEDIINRVIRTLSSDERGALAQVISDLDEASLNHIGRALFVFATSPLLRIPAIAMMESFSRREP